VRVVAVRFAVAFPYGSMVDLECRVLDVVLVGQE